MAMTAGSTRTSNTAIWPTQTASQLKQKSARNERIFHQRQPHGWWELWSAAVVRDIWDFMVCREETISRWSMASCPPLPRSGPADFILYSTHNPGSPQSAVSEYFKASGHPYICISDKSLCEHPSFSTCFPVWIWPLGNSLGIGGSARAWWVQAIGTVCCGLSPPCSTPSTKPQECHKYQGWPQAH